MSDAAQNALPDGQEKAPERDYEGEAREMGWLPKEEFKGPEDKWRPAEEFVKRGEEILPIVQATNRRLKDELGQKDADFAKRIDRLERTNKKAIDALQKRHEAEMEGIKAKQRKAVDEGDLEAYDALEKRKEALAKEAPGNEPEQDNETIQKEWMAENKWYTSDFELNSEATQYSQWLLAQNPDITMTENLEKTTAYIKEKHPEKFGETSKKKANGHAAVDGGGSFPGGGGGGKKTYADLPAEAKAACDQFVADKVMTKEAYVKDYFSDD